MCIFRLFNRRIIRSVKNSICKSLKKSVLRMCNIHSSSNYIRFKMTFEPFLAVIITAGS